MGGHALCEARPGQLQIPIHVDLLQESLQAPRVFVTDTRQQRTWLESLIAVSLTARIPLWQRKKSLRGLKNKVFGTISHHAHRIRRSSMSALFSRAAAIASLDMVYEHAEALLRAVDGQIARNGSAEMRMTCLSLATDTVTHYTFGESTDYLEDEQKMANWKSTIQAVSSWTPIAKQFPWAMPIGFSMPYSLLKKLNPDLARVAKLRAV
jgi:hypothetical protein